MKPFRFILNPLFALVILATLGGWQSMAVAESADQATTQGQITTVDINSASASELAEMLDGIGEAKAKAIIAYREEHGPFTAVEQLLLVKGVGEATLDKNRDRIRLN